MNSKFKYCLFLLTFLVSWSASSQELYEGTLTTLKVGLELNAADGKALLYIPEQGLFAHDIQNPVFRNDSLIADLKAFNTVLTGKISDNTFDGSWKQNGYGMPLKLQKVASLSFLRRPQHPAPPYPYAVEDVKFTNVDKSITFGGTFTYPSINYPLTTVILISGSGQQDRDETIFGHKPFWVLADHLSRNGFAVLRVDDRGVGQTTGTVGTSADYAKDVLAAMAYLKTRKEVNPRKIGLIGHSEGGVIAPMVAQESKQVAFMVSLAGVGVKGYDLLLQQNDDMLKKTGVGEAFREHYRSLNSALYDVILRNSLENDLKDSLQIAFDNWLQKQPDAVLGQMGFKSEIGKKSVTRQFDTLNSKWYRYFLKYDPQPVLAQLKIPVLALNGGSDLQVSAKENLRGFEKGLQAAGNKNFKIIELAGLNHLFQKCQKCTVAEYGLLEETFSTEALDLITDWLKKQ